MAAARPQMTEGSGGAEGAGGDEAPLAFREAVTALTGARPRAEVTLSPLPAPRRLAPYAFALEASVAGGWDEGAPGPPPGHGEDPPELADGRFVLLHDPAGQDAWRGGFRVVTLVRAELEPEMGGDPLLPEVAWQWLTGALEARSVGYGEASGTVTRSGSSFFGGLEDRPPRTELEIRASWTPEADGPAGTARVPGIAAHLTAWCELLCQVAGLPPEGGEGTGVLPLPQRRGPRGL